MSNADLIARARVAAEKWDGHSSDLLLELAAALEAVEPQAPPAGTQELAEWLTAAFSVDEARRLARYYAPRSFAALPVGPQHTGRDVFDALARAALSTGEVGALLAAARMERPRRAAQVDALAAALGVKSW